MNPAPPKWPLRFLRWFCREDSLDEIEGDLRVYGTCVYLFSHCDTGRLYFDDTLDGEVFISYRYTGVDISFSRVAVRC